jgi:hypothetical protein
MTDDAQRFADLSFDDFRRMAQDDSLSSHEKIGFPDSYRQGYEQSILADIVRKVPALSAQRKVILDIGPGCSGLARMIVERCRTAHHQLILVDSQEMLDHTADEPFIHKVPAFYPNCDALFERYRGAVDGIVVYSVFHYMFEESNIWTVLDRSLSLLNHGGALLFGDIPNVSKRKRFFSSTTGIRFHQEFTRQQGDIPQVEFNRIEQDKIDDAVLLGLMMRARLAGYDAFVVPQDSALPMANRREDLLIVRP